MRRHFVIDAIIVALFAAIGRLSHQEGLTLTGWLHTAWPFAVGLLLAWLVLRHRATPLSGGVGVGLLTMAIGMLLRSITGAGVALSFMAVATTFLVGLMVISRAITARTRR